MFYRAAPELKPHRWHNLMTVKLILRGHEYEVKSGMTLRDSIMKIGILPDTVLATRDNELITDDEILKHGDVIKLIMVISGGSTLMTDPA